MTDSQSTAINEVIEKYDCHFKGLLESKNLRILYPHEMHRILASCSNATSINEPISVLHLTLVKQIKDVLHQQK